MYNYILVPLDGSTFSQSALPFAKQLAKGFNVPIVLFHSVDPGQLYSLDETHGSINAYDYSDEFKSSIETTMTSTHTQNLHYLDSIIESEQALADGYLATISKSLAKDGIKVSEMVEIGPPADTILRFVERQPSGLTVMSTHGRGGIARWFLGSVANKVLYGSSSPVLLVRPREDGVGGEGFRSIVAPLDGTPLAESVLPTAVYVAKTLGIPIHLVQSVPTSGEIWVGVEPTYYYSTDIEAVLLESGEKYLSSIVDRLQKEGIEARTTVKMGRPDFNITEHASEVDDSLIIMATHSRKGVASWLLGTVAERVVRSSHRPVLLIRASESAESEEASAFQSTGQAR